MIRKGFIFICVILSAICVWLMFSDSRSSGMDHQNISKNSLIQIPLWKDKNIQVFFDIQNGITIAECHFVTELYESWVSTAVSGSPQSLPPMFDLYHYREQNCGWKASIIYGFNCPTWFLVLLLLIYPSIAFFKDPVRRRWRNRKGLCLHCGYDLRGTSEPRCPECGKESEHTAASTEEINE